MLIFLSFLDHAQLVLENEKNGFTNRAESVKLEKAWSSGRVVKSAVIDSERGGHGFSLFNLDKIRDVHPFFAIGQIINLSIFSGPQNYKYIQ